MYGFGRGGGWGRGAGWTGAAYPQRACPAATAPAGYRYVGSCRCGFGPNAYYQDLAGRVVPAAGLFSGTAWTPPAQAPSEIEQLGAEKADLERRLRDLEERLKGTP